MVLSITICTYNRIEHLKKCLKSVLDQTQGNKSIEINIIDNNSTDNTKSYISEIQNLIPSCGKSLIVRMYFLIPILSINSFLVIL